MTLTVVPSSPVGSGVVVAILTAVASFVPNAATIESGAMDGSPWLALEYVEGERIDQHCQRRGLSLDERLELFRTVCSAVHYAHQNLVVHRDLKPGNILITKDGAPKLLDFGIARLLDAEGAARDVTLTGQRMMTLEYASPEQICGQAVTTASDVYSLGVILYELLAGKRPYETAEKSLSEAVRIICEDEPVKPSLSIQSEKQRRRLEGDLDDIVLMALRKEPARRYSSVEQFSEDLRRHIEGRTVTASRHTFAYRSAKFVRRNKVAVAATALVVLSLLTGIILAVWQARSARAQERIAREQATMAKQERDKARRINEFMREIFSNANPVYGTPGHGKGPDVTLVDAIRYAEKQIDVKFKDQPEIRGELHYTLGLVWKQRGEYQSAEPHVRAALELFRQVYGERHPRAAHSLFLLGDMEGRKGNRPAELTMMRQSVEMMRLSDPRHGAFPWMLLDLGERLTWEASFAEAESLILEAREAFRRTLGTEDHYSVAYTYCRLGNLYKGAGELERAEAAYHEYLERLRRLPVKHEAGEALYNLGVIDYTRGNYREAEKRLNEAEKLFSRYLGESYPQIADFLYYLASIDCLQGDHARAEAEARRALEIRRRQKAPDHPTVIISLGLLSKVLISAGRPADAAAHLREAMEKFRAAPNRTGQLASAAGILGECLTLLKRYDESERVLIEGHAGFESDCCKPSPEWMEARQRLVKLYEAWGKPDQAARFR